MYVSTVASNTVTVDGAAASFTTLVAAGLAKDANGNLYVWDDDGLKALRTYIQGTGAMSWGTDLLAGKTITVLGDINAKKVTWETIVMNTGNPNCDGFTFDGNGYTIYNLTINGNGLFDRNANNGNGAPTTFKDITFDNVTVNGGWHTGVIWGQAHGDLVANNVNVINSTITGECNVGGIIGRNGDSGAAVEITFNNCSVKNTVITAKGELSYSNPNGAAAFLGSALKTDSTVVLTFTGNNVVDNVTLYTPAGRAGTANTIYNVWYWNADGSDTYYSVESFTNYDNR